VDSKKGGKMISFESEMNKNISRTEDNKVRMIDVGTAVYSYNAREDDELTLKIGDVVEIISKEKDVSGDDGWWLGRIHGTKVLGVFPYNYVICHTCCLHKYTCCQS